MNDLERRVQTLPTWARKFVGELTRRLAEAEERHQEYLDDQTPSPVYVEDVLLSSKRYIQDRQVTCESGGVYVRLSPHDDFVRVEFGAGEGGNMRAFISPHATNVIHILPGDKR